MIFSLSKIVWTLLSPGNLLLLGLVVASLALLAPWRRLRVCGGTLLGFALVGAVAIAVLPLGAWVLAPLENRFPPLTAPPRVDGIIVLGGAIDLPRSVDRGAAALNASADRMTAFVDLARRYPDAKLVFSGGSGLLFDQIHREADYAAPLFQALGLAPGRVLFERDSRNTHENAVMTADLAQPQPGEVWLLVTSAYHMPRAVGAMRRAGWHVIAAPVDYLTGARDTQRIDFDFARGLKLTTVAGNEWLGLLVYRWLDRTDTLFPGPAS